MKSRNTVILLTIVLSVVILGFIYWSKYVKPVVLMPDLEPAPVPKIEKNIRPEAPVLVPPKKLTPPPPK